jgi:hypothetical protein
MGHRWNEIDRGKPKYSGGKTCPSATLSTTNPTWTDPGSNPGLCSERPATNRLSHEKRKLLRRWRSAYSFPVKQEKHLKSLTFLCVYFLPAVKCRQFATNSYSESPAMDFDVSRRVACSDILISEFSCPVLLARKSA